MKKWVLSLTLTAGVIGLAACGGADGESIAKTDAGNVTKEELYESMKGQIGDQALFNLVLEKVLANEYSVSDDEINERFEEVKAQVGPQFELLLPSYGFKDVEDFRQSIKLSLLQEKAAVKDIEVTEDEVRDFYENEMPERQARHIIVEDEDTINEVKSKLDEGEDFAELAQEYSMDGTKESGGDLGYISYDDPNLDEQFKEAAFQLEVDEISDPVQSSFGWHIIQITAIEEKAAFEDAKEDYEYRLKVSKLDSETVQRALKTELENANLEVTDEDLEGTFDMILNMPEEAPVAEDNSDEESETGEEDSE